MTYKPDVDKMVRAPSESKQGNTVPREGTAVTPLRPTDRGTSFIKVNK